MERGARAFASWQQRRDSVFCPDASQGELDLRDKTGRRLRTRLRRMQPTILLTPRWSEARDFMQGLSLELAVDEPALMCRSVAFSGLRGHGKSEARQRVLTALAELSAAHWSEVQVPYVASGEGFVVAAKELMHRAQEQEHRIAMLAEGVDRIHVDVLSALSEAWNQFQEEAGVDRRFVLLMAGSLPTHRFEVEGADEVSLPDLARKEALRLLSPGEACDEQTEMALQFAGGVPRFVGALSEGVQKLGGLPYSSTGLIRLLGAVEGEVRQVLDLLASDPRLAERLESLAGGEEHGFEAGMDERLIESGVIRLKPNPRGDSKVVLRAPLLAAMLG